MGQAICFIGDPGEKRGDWLRALRAVGLSPLRVSPEALDIGVLRDDPPCAIVLGSGVENRDQMVVELRQCHDLDGVPLVARLCSADEEAVERAFSEGVDDVVIDGATAQIEAFAAKFGTSESWSGVRAPSGLVLLADENRQERIRMSHVLRRAGFDSCFASNVAELEEMLSKGTSPRAIIASADLPGGPLTENLERIIHERRVTGPWVITHAEQADYAAEGEAGQGPKVVFDNGTDAERLTFLLNELLAPAPPEGRRTPRLLYESMATFTHEGSSDVFYGYTYNINAGGIFMRTLTPPPKQSRVEVRFRPPCGRGDVVMVAQVVWVKEFSQESQSASPAGVGVQFVDIAPADGAGYEAGYQALLEMHGYGASTNSMVAASAGKSTVPPSGVLADGGSRTSFVAV